MKRQLKPYYLRLNFEWRTKLHVAWAALGTYIADYGLYCIWTQKNLAEKAHFTSWHGKFGLAAMAGMLTMHLSGIVIFHWGTKSLKKYHKIGSKVVFGLFLGAFTLSFWSNWATKNLPEWIKYAFTATTPLYLLQAYHK